MPYFTIERNGYKREEVDAFIVKNSEETNALIAEKDAEIKRLVSELAETKRNMERVEAECAEKISTKEAETAEQKEKYERLCIDVGEKILLADERAKNVIAESEAKAAQKLKDAEEEARILAAEQLNKLLEETKERCKLATESAEEYIAYAEKIGKGLSGVIADIDTLSESITKSIDSCN